MTIVNIKGVGKARFPNDMPIDDIRMFLKAKFASDVLINKLPTIDPLPNTIEPRRQSLSERFGQGIADTLINTGIISNRAGAQRIGKNISALGEFLPIIGDATAGDELGRALFEGDKSGIILSAVGAIPVVGDLAKKVLKNKPTNLDLGFSEILTSKPKDFIDTVGNKAKKIKDIDFDFPITHGSLDPNFDGVIKKGGIGNIFDGLFGSLGEISEAGGVKQITFFPRKGKVMGSGDIDVDSIEGVEWLKKEFPDADEDRLDDLYDIILDDKNVFDKPLNPLDVEGFEDLGEASWEAQRLRGKYAADHDFDAVEMDDEFGTSFLIPFNSKAIRKQSDEITP